MLGSEPDLKMHVQNLGCFSPKNWAQARLPILDIFRRLSNLTTT